MARITTKREDLAPQNGSKYFYSMFSKRWQEPPQTMLPRSIFFHTNLLFFIVQCFQCGGKDYCTVSPFFGYLAPQESSMIIFSMFSKRWQALKAAQHRCVTCKNFSPHGAGCDVVRLMMCSEILKHASGLVSHNGV